MKPLYLILFFLTTGFFSTAQNRPERDSLQSGFQDFERQWDQDLNRFISGHDTDLAQFIRKHEAGFLLFMDSLQSREKPARQPRFNSETGTLDFVEADTSAEMEHEKRFQVYIDSVPEKNEMNIYGVKSAFNFYGKEPEQEFTRLGFRISDASESSVKQFSRYYASDNALKTNKIELNRIILDLKLNDFGNFLFLRKAVPFIFPGINEQALFVSLYLRYTLHKDILIGFQGRNIYCLARFDKNVYNLMTIEIDKKKYHVLLMPGQKAPEGELGYYQLFIKPDPEPMKLDIINFPKLKDRIATRSFPFNGDTLKVNTNQFLIEYLNEFPATNLQVYFNAPVSETALKTLDKALMPLLAGKKPEDQVRTLLTFFRQSFIYKTDRDQFGREKYMFSDESLYYPYTDCEDRAVLFSKLVMRYTGLPVIGLEYPKHVSVAVSFPVGDGDPVTFKARSYFICDPTILGLQVGSKMPAEYAAQLKIIEITLSDQNSQ
jgi:hypothetical protein